LISEARTITLLSELVHLPLTHSPEKLRELYNEVCRTCGYENFIRVPGGARIERSEGDGGGMSQIVFLADRVQLSEDHTGISVEQFGKKILAVLSAAMPTLGIPFILVQVCTARMVAAPHGFRNAAEYLARSVFRIQPEDLEPLGRPTSVFGFRLVCPATTQQPHNYNVRVECYARDARSLYLENVGTFKMPIQASNLSEVERNLRATSGFLEENVIAFLSRFDRKEGD
jgi:hypothetical protein